MRGRQPRWRRSIWLGECGEFIVVDGVRKIPPSELLIWGGVPDCWSLDCARGLRSRRGRSSRRYTRTAAVQVEMVMTTVMGNVVVQESLQIVQRT
jgi:hypothetical protein